MASVETTSGGVCLPSCSLCLATMVIVGVVVKVAVLSAALIAVNKSEILLRLSEARAYGSAWWPQRVAKHKGLLIYGCRPNLTGASLCEGWKGVQVPQHRNKGGGVSDTSWKATLYHHCDSWIAVPHILHLFTNDNCAIIYCTWQWNVDYPDISVAMSRAGISSKVPTNEVFHYNKGTIHFKISQQEALPLPPLRHFSADQRHWSEMRIYVHTYTTLSMLFSELPQIVTLKWIKVLFLNKPRTSRLVSMSLPSASATKESSRNPGGSSPVDAAVMWGRRPSQYRQQVFWCRCFFYACVSLRLCTRTLRFDLHFCQIQLTLFSVALWPQLLTGNGGVAARQRRRCLTACPICGAQLDWQLY